MLISHVNPRLLQADWTIFSPQANGIWAAGRVYLLDLFLIKVYIYIYISHSDKGDVWTETYRNFKNLESHSLQEKKKGYQKLLWYLACDYYKSQEGDWKALPAI